MVTPSPGKGEQTKIFSTSYVPIVCVLHFCVLVHKQVYGIIDLMHPCVNAEIAAYSCCPFSTLSPADLILN